MAAAGRDQAPNMELFDSYFRRADLDRDGRISGAETVAFFQGANLPKHVLAQIWTYADQNRAGFLGRPEFYNALRLITVAQSGRQLTPDIVKAALYGPAAAKIPAPQMNPVSSPAVQMNTLATPTPQLNPVVQPSSQMGVAAPPASQNLGFRGPQANPSMGVNQQFFPPSGNHFVRPAQATPAPASLPTHGVNQLLSGSGPHLPGSNTPNLSTDWLGARTGASVSGISQGSVRGVTPSTNHEGFGLAISSAAPGVSSTSQTQSGRPSSSPLKPLDQVLSSSQPAADNSKAVAITGNGFSSDSVFGGGMFTPAFSGSSMPNSSGIAPVSGSQNTIKTGQLDSLQSSPIVPQGSGQLQQTQSLVKQNQLDTVPSTSAMMASSHVSVGPGIPASSQSQLHWPRITQSDIQKYSDVFVEVDKDRDGKITGEQARNLFLSWRLPREVLKQVWDLSDQDNDSMLSLKEFCTALYLMERFREGRPLPAVLPNTLKFDETLLHATAQPSTAYSGLARQPHPGLSQQGIPASRPPLPVTGIRPPVQSPFPLQTDGSWQTMQQKSRMPVLEKHLVNQLSKEEQSALNSKFQEATDADKNVKELENQILDSREKIEFYRTKMQELVLYKSRCDNRLNEITERASADKREAELLAKKYEEKYKQVGELASKLTVEEATYRDIQERKLELHNAIVKMEQGGSADGLLQVRADRIQSDLEELMRGLNERCKRNGLHVKHTAIIELPFGWQPGIQEGAADWVEDWDKFEDVGFTVEKGLSIDVDNVVATAKPKSPSAWSDKASTDDFSPVSSSNVTGKHEKHFGINERITESGSAYDQSEVGSGRSPPSSPGRSALESPSKEFHSTQFGMHDFSPRSKGSHSDHGGAESTISGDKYADEPSWVSSFDANDDVDSVWGFNTTRTKETDYDRGRRDSFEPGGFGLNPIKVDSPSAGSVFGTDKKSTFFADSVPSTPLFSSGFSPKFNEGPEDHSYNSFGRFDSFSTQGSVFFPQPESLTRFDSTRSTAEFDRSRGESFARFDSIRSTAEFDHSRGFPSFDDADPFGSTGPFKSSERRSPRRGSNNWSAF